MLGLFILLITLFEIAVIIFSSNYYVNGMINRKPLIKIFGGQAINKKLDVILSKCHIFISNHKLCPINSLTTTAILLMKK